MCNKKFVVIAGKCSMISSIILSLLILETSKRVNLFSIFSGEKLNFLSISVVTSSLAIRDSFSFSRSFGCFRPFFVFLLYRKNDVIFGCPTYPLDVRAFVLQKQRHHHHYYLVFLFFLGYYFGSQPFFLNFYTSFLSF